MKSQKGFAHTVLLILLVAAVGVAVYIFLPRKLPQNTKSAIGSYDCPQVTGPTFDDSYYKGPLIDTHYHIPNLPETPFFNDIQPILGKNMTISDIICTLNQEGTKKAFAFFPVFPGMDKEYLDLAKETMELYPDTLVPFIMPPESDNDPGGFPTVDAEYLEKMLTTYPGLFKGFGEIGLYERKGGAKALPPDSQRLLAIYPVVRKHSLVVYFHLGEGQQESFEKILDQNPDINFIWHGDQLIPYEDGIQNLKHIEEILERHSNAFYTVDELYGDQWMIRPEVKKDEFLKYLQNYEELLEKDVATWKAAIERHPDQFMWGTDRSPQILWSHDPEVGQALSNYGRFFISRLNPAVQEKFAWKNAERLLK